MLAYGRSGGAHSPLNALFGAARNVAALGVNTGVNNGVNGGVTHRECFADRVTRHVGVNNGVNGHANGVNGERFADPDGRIRATFDIVWLSGWAPHDSQPKPLKPGSAKASLEAAVKGVKR